MNGEKRSYKDTIEEFESSSSARKMLIKSLKELIPQQDNQGKWNGVWVLVVDIVLAAFFAVKIGWSTNSLSIFLDIVDKMLDMEIAIFGCVFTVYTILLAFFSDDYMKRLAKIKVNEKESYLQEAINYFGAILFLWFLNIGITAFSFFLTKTFDIDWQLFHDRILNNSICSIVLFFLFAFSFRVFLELKSTIYSLIILFRGSIAYRFLGYEEQINNISTKDSITKNNKYN